METEIKWIRKVTEDTFTREPVTEYFFNDDAFKVKITKVWPRSKDWIFEIRIFDERNVIASSWELTKELLPIVTVNTAKAICENIIHGIDKMNNDKNFDKLHFYQLIWGQLYLKEKIKIKSE